MLNVTCPKDQSADVEIIEELNTGATVRPHQYRLHCQACGETWNESRDDGDEIAEQAAVVVEVAREDPPVDEPSAVPSAPPAGVADATD